MVNTTVTGTPAAIWPAFTYDDPYAAIKFLVTAFGFTEGAVYGDGDRVDHAELRWPGGGGIMLGSRRADSPMSSLPSGTGAVYIIADNPDELYARAVAAGATITRELRDEDYGSRGFSCRDPQGVHWSFGTYTGE